MAEPPIPDWSDGHPIPPPDLGRLRRRTMGDREAEEAARYVEALQRRVEAMSDYVREAAGEESVLLPVSALSELIARREHEDLRSAAEAVLGWYLRMYAPDPRAVGPEHPIGRLRAALGR